MSLISQEGKQYLEGIFTKVAETFERDIYVHADGAKAYISTDPSFSRFSPRADEIPNIPNVTTIKARIWYERKQASQNIDVLEGGTRDEAQIKVEGEYGLARIKVNVSGRELIKEAKQIQIDGVWWAKDTPERPHGLFNPNYYTFFLERMQ